MKASITIFPVVSLREQYETSKKRNYLFAEIKLEKFYIYGFKSLQPHTLNIISY